MIRGHNCLPNGLTKCHKLPSNPPTKIPINKIQTIRKKEKRIQTRKLNLGFNNPIRYQHIPQNSNTCGTPMLLSMH